MPGEGVEGDGRDAYVTLSRAAGMNVGSPEGRATQDPRDPGYRRLRYCRYADDTLLGFAGPKAEAEQIRQCLAAFLRDDLRLELSPDKTLITRSRTQRARFQGYEITVASSDPGR